MKLGKPLKDLVWAGVLDRANLQVSPAVWGRIVSRAVNVVKGRVWDAVGQQCKELT